MPATLRRSIYHLADQAQVTGEGLYRSGENNKPMLGQIFATNITLARGRDNRDGDSGAGIAAARAAFLRWHYGGKLHQIASSSIPVVTTAGGGPVSDDSNSPKIRVAGPTVLKDSHFREKIFDSDHERLSEAEQKH